MARVVAGEAAPGASPAALEALAITSRTYAMANLGRHRVDGFDLCDLTHCQVVRPSTTDSRAAAAGTRGLVLLDGNRPATVFYTASCGGRTADSSEVWPELTRPFLVAHDDPACADSEPWVAEIEAARLVPALNTAGWVGSRLSNLGVSGRTASGRVDRLAVPGLVPPEITGEAFRLAVGRSLGWHLVKSTAFEVERIGAGYRLRGRGSGHGVGLCVVGSTRMAGDGATARAILAFYFPGLDVGSLTADRQVRPVTSGLRLALPPSARGRYQAIESLVERVLSELEDALGETAPERLDVRFHPTVEAYQRETRRPWWTSAVATAHRVELIPLHILESRGAVESTLRHELVHVLTMPLLGTRPLWVQEGAAAYFAGESSHAAESRPCPGDDEFNEAGSGAELAGLYERAAGCYAREISDGVSWAAVGQPIR